jgi:hypothetical protein
MSALHSATAQTATALLDGTWAAPGASPAGLRTPSLSQLRSTFHVSGAVKPPDPDEKTGLELRDKGLSHVDERQPAASMRWPGRATVRAMAIAALIIVVVVIGHAIASVVYSRRREQAPA